MGCEACKQKDALIDRLLDRLEIREPEGVTVMDQVADDMEAQDEGRMAKELENMGAAQEITDRFRSIHLRDPYADCKIIEDENA